MSLKYFAVNQRKKKITYLIDAIASVQPATSTANNDLIAQLYYSIYSIICSRPYLPLLCKPNCLYRDTPGNKLVFRYINHNLVPNYVGYNR